MRWLAWMVSEHLMQWNVCLKLKARKQGDWNTLAACCPRGPFVLPATLFGNFQIMNIYVSKCLEKDAAKKLNQTWMIPSSVFVPALAKQTTFHKNFQNLRSMPKTSTYALSTSRKHTTGFIVKSVGECCASAMLTGAYWWSLRSSAWALSLCGHKTRAFKHRKAVVF